MLLPAWVLAQSADGYPVFENGVITPNPAKITEFEQGMAAHNKKYHAEGPYGARVYFISNGKNVGKYMWVMGPLPWSAMDQRPAQEGHDADWNTNVMPYMMAEGDQDYWRFHPDLSNFPADFDLKNLLVFVLDVKRFKTMEFMEKVLKKVQQLYLEKKPEQAYGVYTNEMSNRDGKDIAWVNFFASTSWLGQPDTFPQEFEAVHGAGSFAQFLKDVEATTDGEMQELWIFREDLSGLSGSVTAVSRQ